MRCARRSRGPAPPGVVAGTPLTSLMPQGPRTERRNAGLRRPRMTPTRCRVSTGEPDIRSVEPGPPLTLALRMHGVSSVEFLPSVRRPIAPPTGTRCAPAGRGPCDPRSRPAVARSPTLSLPGPTMIETAEPDAGCGWCQQQHTTPDTPSVRRPPAPCNLYQRRGLGVFFFVSVLAVLS